MSHMNVLYECKDAAHDFSSKFRSSPSTTNSLLLGNNGLDMGHRGNAGDAHATAHAVTHSVDRTATEWYDASGKVSMASM